MAQFTSNDDQSTFILRVAGYSLLLLGLFDCVYIFIPANFTNPAWEFQMIGQIVERVPVPLLGLVLIFYGDDSSRSRLEEVVLKLLSWLALLLGLLFILLIPLGIVNTWRIDNQNTAQINKQASERMLQLKQVEDKLNNAKTNEEFKQLFSSINSQGRAPKIDNPLEYRKQLFLELSKAKKMVENQVTATKASTRLALLKNSVKWNLGALVSGFAFVWMWHATAWTRRPWRN